MRKNKYIAISILLLLGCSPDPINEKNFYSQELLESDVLRLPIIFPYDLVSIDATTPWQSGTKLSERLGNFVIIDSINVQGNFLFFHASSNARENYVILELENNEPPHYLDRIEYTQTLDSLKITPKIFPVDSIYPIWRSKKTLPWK